MKRITIKEIANKAGVSIGTVDRVLHNRGEVAPKTKELVLKVAKEGNYTTNVFARSLKLNRTYQIAVLLPNDNEYWVTQNQSVRQASERYNSLGISPNFLSFDRQSSTSLQQQVAKVLSAEPDGVILAPLVENKILDLTHELDRRNVPYVFVDSNLEVANPITFIGQNSFKAGFLAAKLLNLGFPRGHKVYIARFYDFDSLNKTIEERIKGFKEYYRLNKFHHELIKDVDLSKDPAFFLKEVAANGIEGPLHVFVPNSRSHQLAQQFQDFSGATRTVGFDLIHENQESLKSGEIDFIIDQNPSKQGELAIQAFYDRLISNTNVREIQLMALEIFTKENLPE